MTTTAHGAERNHRYETTHGPSRKLLDQRTGEVVHDGPLSSFTQTVSERYCAHCRTWVEVRGILGVLGFDHDHRHGDA